MDRTYRVTKRSISEITYNVKAENQEDALRKFHQPFTGDLNEVIDRVFTEFIVEEWQTAVLD